MFSIDYDFSEDRAWPGKQWGLETLWTVKQILVHRHQNSPGATPFPPPNCCFFIDKWSIRR